MLIQSSNVPSLVEDRISSPLIIVRLADLYRVDFQINIPPEVNNHGPPRRQEFRAIDFDYCTNTGTRGMLEYQPVLEAVLS